MDKGRLRFWTKGLKLFIGLLILVGWCELAQSEETYPTREIDVIVAFSPGGGTDTSCRIAANYLKKKWGVIVNVVNKPGGQTLPANMEVYSSAPNGYTVLADQEACSSMAGLAMKQLPFKVMDRTFICTMVMTPIVFMVPHNSPYKNLEDAMEDAKKDPKNFTWASLGGTGVHDWFFRQFFKVAGVDVSKTQPVPTKGGAAATALVGGGHVKIGSTTIASCGAAAKAGAIRLLGIARERNPEFPDVPTTAELGYPEIDAVTWVGFSGPPGLSSSIVDKWQKAVKEMLQDPESLSRLKKVGFSTFYLDSKGMKKFVLKQISEVRELYGVEGK